jgi:hypothetical protein
MQPSTNKVTPSTRRPLSPLNLLLAGVTPSEVVWFRKMGPGEQMRSLHQSERGRQILGKVREHQARKMCGAPMPQRA